MTVAPAGENGIADGSPLAAIREAVEATRAKTTTDLELPGALEGHLKVRCRALPWRKSEQIRERYQQSDDERARVLLCMDHLINACDCLLVKDGAKWVPLIDEGRKVRIDATLAANLGIPDGKQGDGPPDTHVICAGLFAAAAGGLSDPDEGVSREDHWQQALEHADHLIETTHTQYAFWLKGGVDVGAEQEEMLGE